MVVIYSKGQPIAIPTLRFGKTIEYRTDTYTIPKSGKDYKIRFIVGSYDFTGKQKLGAKMEIDSFGRVDKNGKGYNMCRLLSRGCNQVEVEGGGGLARRE